ncbi:MAG: hydrogenase formation protein HypD [Thermodesulfovibrionales bacterium]|nr:hydrogenase formation protein HypD [Thermodesulfovibrionales bacterium]
MKELAELIKKFSRLLKREIRLMEVCGTHTVAIFRSGIRSILPENIKLLSGPGCPVCVTPHEDIDMAIELSKNRDVILLTFGDMMRVPGTKGSLQSARAEGSDIRVIYTPMDMIDIALCEPQKTVIFFAVGFETTSPLIAGTLFLAEQNNIKNLFIYSCHKLVPPALRALLEDKNIRIDGLILPGHVSTIIGSEPYKFIKDEYHVPSVISGFEPDDILQSIAILIENIISEKSELTIQYTRSVRPEGNKKALDILYRFFEPADAWWRGIGIIPDSGLRLKDEYRNRDIIERFGIKMDYRDRSPLKGCRCGDVLKGKIIPPDCPLFKKVCTPENPVGACMVSVEGSCSAYYKYYEPSFFTSSR